MEAEAAGVRVYWLPVLALPIRDDNRQVVDGLVAASFLRRCLSDVIRDAAERRSGIQSPLWWLELRAFVFTGSRSWLCQSGMTIDRMSMDLLLPLS
ncbi:hypothetical protein CHH27_11335 [Labrenzia sp. VG12]|nr:hypothetical protein CHH27_11335 [Labrenzia sp. VG12]